MDLVVVRHHVIQWVILLVLNPLALAGGLRYLVSGEVTLHVSATVDHVGDVSGFVQRDGVVEVPSMHHGGGDGWLVVPSPDPGKALLVGDPLWDGERLVDGVQLGMTIYATIVPYIRPRKETRVGGDVPFLFLLQELESRWSFSLGRGGPDSAWPGRDDALRLDFGRIGAVIRFQMVTVLNGAVTVAKCKSVSGRRGTS